MRRLFYVVTILFSFCFIISACYRQERKPASVYQLSKNTAEIMAPVKEEAVVTNEDTGPVIEEECRWYANLYLTPEDIAHFDSMNEHEGIFVRGAERDLDTIVNHFHLIFIKEQGYDTPRDEDKHSILLRDRKEE